MIKVILDTNIIISASLSKQSIPAQVLDYTMENTVLLISEATRRELSEKLLQSKFDRYVTRIARQLFLEKFETFCETVIVSTTIDACRDNKDNKFLELSVDGKADFIVTGDKDLLVLNPFKKVQIITPSEFLVSIKKTSKLIISKS
jgi:putative PIN family toxin of toxin-antitoxin system